MSTKPARISPEEWLTGESFRLLVDSVSDYAIFMLDADGYIRTWNAGANRIKQYTAAEILGQHFSVFYPEEDVKAGKCELELRVANEVGRFEDEGWRVRRDGTRFWANVVITALRSPDGSLRGFAKVTRDLSERRAVEESLRASELRLRLLIESVQDYAIFMLDPEGRVTTWNAGAQRIKQYRADEIIGKHVSTFYPGGPPAGPNRELETAASVGRYEEEGWRIRKDGSKFWANVVLTAIRGEKGELVGFAKVTRDLTERRNAEREQTARVAAEEASRAKDEFLAVLGHELRNPLAPTLTALQLMKLRGDIRSSREQQVIERQVKHMVRLVDDLLDLSRISRGTIELQRERFDLREAIARGLDMASPLIQERRHEIDVEVPPEEICIEGDAVRLTQAFANLLNNAAKYTPQGGHIRLAVRTEGDDAVVEVHDDGIGIAPEFLPKVYETFVQAPQSLDRPAGGLGIGLSVVRAVVELHGGSVEAASPGLGAGSTFTVRLAIRDRLSHVTPCEEAHAVGGLGIPRTERSLRVLVVDDNEDALFLTADVLRLAGHDVRTAPDGAAALELAADFTPDAAVLDVGLPDMDGYELASRLRDMFAARALRLIAMTGYGQPTDREQSRRAGFDVHLVKPVDVQALVRSVGGASIATSGDNHS